MGVYDEVMGTGKSGSEPAGIEAPTSVETPSWDQGPFLPQLDENQFNDLLGTQIVSPVHTKVSTPQYDPHTGRPIVTTPAAGGKAGKIVALAQQFVGTPYVWGGTSPDGFDCSGLVQYVYGKLGVQLPRISADQARAGVAVPLRQLRAGDLVAWDNSSRNNGADHIAIYIGGGMIVEAPRPGTSVRVRKLGSNEGARGVRVL
jgi:cell wall-associated NlpC family hydrolase